MPLELIIELSAWVLLGIGIITLIPKDKIRDAWVIFLFKQLLTWLFGLLVVEYNLIEYPVRFFSNATKAHFTYEYFAQPAICVFFNLFYPHNRSLIKQLDHYLIYVSAITVLEKFLEVYTDMIHYIHWTWYWSWISIALTFYLSRKFYVWFFKLDFPKK